MHRIILSILLAIGMMPSRGMAADLVWFDQNKPVSYQLCTKTAPVVTIALEMFREDMKAVTGTDIRQQKGATIALYQLDKAGSTVKSKLKKYGLPVDSVAAKMDAFAIKVAEGQIVIAGNNGRGVAYGLLELSRLAGVSPWVWWGDVVPEHKSRLTVSSDYHTFQAPSVEYRGIFINDEDWTLRNWACNTYEKKGFGVIGPKTKKRVFQLLLRLRANTMWPAMHEGSKSFFTVEGNKEMADSCGILIGTSHCDALLRNNTGEWNVRERGRFNFITNRDQVVDYWSGRLKEMRGKEALYTIGMRGVHDGAMEGVKTLKEKTDGLQSVIDTQRQLLAKYINKDVTRIPQVFIPYKEVLQIMENGLRVPDDVTLMWCDDNYGYMTRLSDAEQQKRSGGGGIYYHLSYWGRPHDYLWLTTNQPGLIYNEMREAYDRNVRRMWIVNVHDPKVAAYDLSLFLDLAWNIDCVNGNTLQQHLETWLCQQFGQELGRELTPVMTEFYRLAAIRKPEHMGWSQVELDKNKVYRGRSQAIDTEFNTDAFGNELERYLADYTAIAQKVDALAKSVRPELRDAYFAAITYPVKAASAMARKMLEAQLSRSYCWGNNDADVGKRKAPAAQHAAACMEAYNEINQLTDQYNNTLAGGKWQGNMDANPRDLPVFNTPSLPVPPATNAVKPSYKANDYGLGTSAIVRNACDYDKKDGESHYVEMLGHSMKAVALSKGASLSYNFTAQQEGEAKLSVAVLPTQANDTGDIRFSVSIDGGEAKVFSLKEPFRSEQWKKNVLRGQAVKTLNINLAKGQHTLTIRALDTHIVADQWLIDFDLKRKAYVFPIGPAI